MLFLNNPCWKKKHCYYIIFSLIFVMLFPNVCISMNKKEMEKTVNDAINNSMEKGENKPNDYTFEQLASVARADREALLRQFPQLKKDMNGKVAEWLVVKTLVKYVMGDECLQSDTPKKFDRLGIIKSGGAGYPNELKAVISWIEFWPYLLNSSWNVNEHFGQIIRSMAVRPAFRPADGPAAVENDVVKMVEMLKRNNSKSTNRTARKRDFLINKFSQNKGEQPVSPSSPGGNSDNSDNDDDMEWKNRGVCMLVGKLVKSLAKVEYEQPFIDLLKDIYEHHKDVLAGKSENLKENLQNQMKELIRGKVQVVKDKLVHLKNKVKQPKILVKAVVEKAKDTVKERGKREG